MNSARIVITTLCYAYGKCSAYNVQYIIQSQPTPLNEDICTIFDLWKMLNFKLNNTWKFLKPTKDLFDNVKQHWTDTFLKLLFPNTDKTHINNNHISGSHENCNLKTILSDNKVKSNNYKALILPSNNGKLVANILRRRTWWRVDKNRDDYDFIWTPLLRKGISIKSVEKLFYAINWLLNILIFNIS